MPTALDYFWWGPTGTYPPTDGAYVTMKQADVISRKPIQPQQATTLHLRQI
jgi:hypothetical protein